MATNEIKTKRSHELVMCVFHHSSYYAFSIPVSSLDPRDTFFLFFFSAVCFNDTQSHEVCVRSVSLRPRQDSKLWHHVGRQEAPSHKDDIDATPF